MSATLAKTKDKVVRRMFTAAIGEIDLKAVICREVPRGQDE